MLAAAIIAGLLICMVVVLGCMLLYVISTEEEMTKEELDELLRKAKESEDE